MSDTPMDDDTQPLDFLVAAAVDAIERITQLETQLAQAVEYGQHKMECACRLHNNSSEHRLVCSCGWTAFKASTGSKQEF